MMNSPAGKLTQMAQWIYEIANSNYHIDNRVFFSADQQDDFGKTWGFKCEKIKSIFDELVNMKSIVGYNIRPVKSDEAYIVYVEYTC